MTASTGASIPAKCLQNVLLSSSVPRSFPTFKSLQTRTYIVCIYVWRHLGVITRTGGEALVSNSEVDPGQARKMSHNMLLSVSHLIIQFLILVRFTCGLSSQSYDGVVLKYSLQPGVETASCIACRKCALNKKSLLLVFCLKNRHSATLRRSYARLSSEAHAGDSAVIHATTSVVSNYSYKHLIHSL